jgi:hydroxymethylglutaryl-CoA reductase (NADPH)
VSLESARGNCENLIGFAQVPVGVAGPLVLTGDFNKSYRVPFAGTEGTMVASYQRGFKLAEACGGVEVYCVGEGLWVYPVLECDGVREALQVKSWVEGNKVRLMEEADSTTSHGRTLEIQASILGARVVVAFCMHTEDAHGINMVTRASMAAMQLVPGVKRILPHGLDVEKRASGVAPRGRQVVASMQIPRSLLPDSAQPKDIGALWATYQLGFARMHTHNHAIQVANGLAAIYLATGQDVAYVAESCRASLSLEDRGEVLLATLDLPNLHVATVGGGTRKGTALEAQSLMEVGSARELACVMGGALLCGDVNLAISFLADDFAGAHERLGRNR